VERETGATHERDRVAGVFVRRLQKGMRLQTDPTVIYGMGDRYKGRIGKRDLRTHTPYNTYRIDGLPPTPIALPGREAIHAALHPDDGDALYFVARGDGTHKFSRTLAEHQKAVREFQLNRRKDYRSSPAAQNDASSDSGDS
ncbi:endolytic transglycosylase MltG, partial [Marinobacter alexandrii]